MRLGACVLISLGVALAAERAVAESASAPAGRPPYEGLWGTSEAACRDEDGVDRMEIGKGRFFWYETRCRAQAVTAETSRAWTMRLSCEGEGQRFSARPRLILETPDRLVMQAAPVGPRRRQVYRRCAGRPPSAIRP